jgi:hypothetical protein
MGASAFRVAKAYSHFNADFIWVMKTKPFLSAALGAESAAHNLLMKGRT